jgi:hypothetical protein
MCDAQYFFGEMQRQPCLTNVMAAYPSAFPPPTMTYLQGSRSIRKPYGFFSCKPARVYLTMKHTDATQQIKSPEREREEHPLAVLVVEPAAAETLKARATTTALLLSMVSHHTTTTPSQLHIQRRSR